jgi:hypothetical protein
MQKLQKARESNLGLTGFPFIAQPLGHIKHIDIFPNVNAYITIHISKFIYFGNISYIVYN